MRLYDHQPAGTVDRARTLRRTASPVERRMLRGLREAFPALKWRHQAPVGPFYADILCFSERLVIEIDGDSHDNMADYDAVRTAAIAREGLRVIRFTNADVTGNLEGVLTAVATELSAGNPLSPRERGRAAQPRRGEGDRTPETGGAE